MIEAKAASLQRLLRFVWNFNPVHPAVQRTLFVTSIYLAMLLFFLVTLLVWLFRTARGRSMIWSAGLWPAAAGIPALTMCSLYMFIPVRAAVAVSKTGGGFVGIMVQGMRALRLHPLVLAGAALFTALAAAAAAWSWRRRLWTTGPRILNTALAAGGAVCLILLLSLELR